MWPSLIALSLLPFVHGNYCEFGLCHDEEQYCCGKNRCCNKSSNLWFVWTAILAVVFVLVVVAICTRKRAAAKDTHGPYEKLATQEFLEEAT